MSKLRFLTAGESHGPGLTVIIEGLPAGLKVDEREIKHQMTRRQKGYGSGGRQKIEVDEAVIRGKKYKEENQKEENNEENK